MARHGCGATVIGVEGRGSIAILGKLSPYNSFVRHFTQNALFASTLYHPPAMKDLSKHPDPSYSAVNTRPCSRVGGDTHDAASIPAERGLGRCCAELVHRAEGPWSGRLIRSTSWRCSPRFRLERTAQRTAERPKPLSRNPNVAVMEAATQGPGLRLSGFDFRRLTFRPW
jgi:hypothetical protein